MLQDHIDDLFLIELSNSDEFDCLCLLVKLSDGELLEENSVFFD